MKRLKMNPLKSRHASAAAILVALAGSAFSGQALAQSTEPFPAQFELSSLLPINGGNGSNGFVLNGIDTRDRSGRSVSSAGDVNGDGIDDLIIGANRARPNGGFRGLAGESYVVFGAADLGARGVGTGGSFDLSALNGANGFVLNGIDVQDESGYSVSSAGDVNGDGIDDLIIGARGSTMPFYPSAGESYVVFGAADLGAGGVGTGGVFELSALNGTNGFVLNGIDERDNSGWSVSSAGDVNGDGIDDLIIGAVYAGSSAGESYVVFGAGDLGAGGVGTGGSFDLSALNGPNGFVLNGIDFPDTSGRSVSSAGDVNGDGIDDLIIGARVDENHGIPFGKGYVVFGAGDLGAGGVGTGGSFDLSALNGPNGFVFNRIDPGVGGVDAGDSINLKAINTTKGFVPNGIAKTLRNGSSVSSAGDVNGDGIDDLIIGVNRADPNGNYNAGESYVVFGAVDLGAGGVGTGGSFNLSALNGPNGFVLNGIDEGDKSGFPVSSAGDVNGDGIDDLIIGAYRAHPNGNESAGESYVVFGAGDLGTGGVGTGGSFDLSAINGTNGFVLNGIDVGDWSGNSVSSAGDVNGDGIDDLIIGARGADPNENSSAGESYVVFGRDVCVPDFVRDGVLDSHDIRAFIKQFRKGEMAADLNDDGALTGHDIRLFISLYQDGCE